MKYTFKTQKLDTTESLYYFIELDDEKNYVLGRLSDNDWTSKKVSDLIHNIEISKEKTKEEEFIWANEDLTIYANLHGIFFVDEIAIRYGERDQEKIGLELSHDDFILFLEDFKKFIEENQ